MVHRSGEALYSSCAGDKPRTCSATICVVISRCTRRCSRSSLVMGAANRGRANKQIVSVRIAGVRRIWVRRMFIGQGMVWDTFPNTLLGRREKRKVITGATHTDLADSDLKLASLSFPELFPVV